jgi:hypothetical protein
MLFAQNLQICAKYIHETPVIVYRDSLQALHQYEASLAYHLHKCRQKKTANSLYQLAVNHAKLNHTDSAFFYLNDYMRYSHDDRLIIVDRAFESLRIDAVKWSQLVSQIEDNYLASLPDGINKEFAIKLFYLSISFYTYNIIEYTALLDLSDSMYKTIIMDGIASKWLNDTYYKSTNYCSLAVIDSLNEMIIMYGFPTKENVGSFGESFILKNLRFITIGDKKYKDLETKFQSGDYDKLAFAYLTDIYLRRHNKKQLYGTQYIYHKKSKKTGNWKVLYKTADFEQINDRRKNMNLPETIEQYATINNIDIPNSYYKTKKK